ncbi:outer membrane protein assembly factor BamD [Salinispirillum sp. LH 10-3-1]|uniref:Outer membrane protein assembly factor BamD n=1 Tax=Salinispirillum sp. LH 10-3-1 TaxID=2952525 RepID=A0AB38YHL2_9GAMM
MFRRFSIFALLVSLLILAGCSGNQTRITTEADSYERAAEFLERGRYSQAIEQLEAMESRFPFGAYATQVQLDLIYASYSDRQYDVAMRRANRFIRLQPAHPDIDYVYYLRGLTSFGMAEQTAGLLSTRNPVDRDISGYERTFAQLREFLTLYPDSEFVEPAKGIMQISRTRLAEYNLNVATYYYQVKKPEAALARLNRLFEDFAGEHVQADGLALAARAYEMQGDDERAAQMVSILRAEFPESDLVRGETLVADFRFRRPLIFWLTLGVVG